MVSNIESIAINGMMCQLHPHDFFGRITEYMMKWHDMDQFSQ
jgi:hypothetical protein